MTIRRGLLVALSPAALLLPAIAAAQDGNVVFDRTGYRLTSLGARVAVSAQVLNGQRRPVPNAKIAYRIQDSEVASVNSRGEVLSKRVGRTRVWAVSGSDSASALILVDQWAARFAFSPPVLRFAAVDERKPLQVQARDASGNAIPGIRPAVACRVLNERIATLGANGQIQARASGVTYVRCADRGVADSVRVEVRQRPVRASIDNKGAFTQKTVGDTFQVRMSAADAEGRPVADARPTWASLEPRVINIDPLTGRARAVGPGATRIVAQVGDITDTVSVTVVAGAGISMPLTPTEAEPEAAATPTVAPRATLRVFASYPTVGDTVRLDVDAKDATGAAVDPSAIEFRSSDPAVVASLGSARIVGVKTGEAFIVARHGSLADSTRITVSPKGSRSVTLAGSSAFVRPSYDTATARRIDSIRVDSAHRAILSSSPIQVASGKHLSLSLVAGQASHATHVSEAVTESRTGLMYGGVASAAWFRKFPVTVAFQTGTLVGEQASRVEDLTVAELEGAVTFAPVPWLQLRGGFTQRGETTPTAAVQWRFASAGVRSQFSFVGGRISSFAGLSLLPMANLKTDSTTTRAADPTSMSGEAGLVFHTGFFSAGVSYYTERFTFPVENGFQRKDQFSMLRFRLGLQAGR